MDDNHNLGILVASLSVVLVLLEVIKELVKRFVFRNGNGRNHYVVECPNHIEGLAERITNIERRVTRDSDAMPDIRRGVDRLVKDHAPDDDGIQRWKIQKSLITLWEQTAKVQTEILSVMKAQTHSVDKMVQAQERTIDAIKSIKGATE